MSARTSRSTRRLIASALLALAGLAQAACTDSEATRLQTQPAAPPLAVTTAVVEEREVPAALEVTGTLVADATTAVAPDADGRVTAIAVERGSVVAAGAVLARLDPAEARNQLREAEATAAQTAARLGLEPGGTFDPRETPEARKAQAAVERAAIEYQRYARLVDMGAVSRSDYDSRRTEFLTAQAQHEAVVNHERQLYQALGAQRARVAIAAKALGDTAVRAPYAGLIAERQVHVGDYVRRGQPIATLMRVDPLRIELAVPEGAVAAVHPRQRVAFEVQTYPGRQFEGRIAYVGPALRAEARALVVEAVVPNPDGLLRPGLFASARVELPAGTPTPFVPAAAVQIEAGVARLFVVAGGRAELRFVQLGRPGHGGVEVLRGVRAGERVALDGHDRLADGAAVVADPPRER
jgi:RND family efflux transporter MFP subunit